MDAWNTNNIATAGLLTAGLLAVAKFVVKAASFGAIYLRPSQLSRYRHATSGENAWALITGSTAGIGEAYAYELASCGFDVVLHGRNPTKLSQAQEKLARAFPNRSFKTVIADTSRCATDKELVDNLVSEVRDLNLTILINNAGGGPTPSFGMLSEYNKEQIIDNVNLNAVFPALLISRLLPVLIRNAPSLVINMGSMTDNGLPLMSFYNASKAFTSTLAQTLARDMMLEEHAVEVMCVRTGGVSGTSRNPVKSDIFNPDARTFVKAALARVGCGRAVVVGYFPHALQQVMSDMLPSVLQERVFLNIMKRRRENERERLRKR